MTTGDIAAIPEGIYTPVPTFFKKNSYDLDIETQVKHAKLLHQSGINGLVTSGSMGEGGHLTRDERVRLVREIKSAIPDPAFKLIEGIPQLNVADTILEIKEVAEAKADFVMVLVPGYFGPKLTSQRGIIDYFSAIADKLDLPIIIYNYPGVSNNVDLTPETVETLLHIPNIVGIKLTHFNLDKYTLIAGNKKSNESHNFRPFTGLGQILVPSLSIGTFGAIDGLSGIFPKTMLKLFSLYKEGSHSEAVSLQYKVTRANQMIMELNLVSVKYALKSIYGLGEIVHGRPPLNYQISEEDYKKYEGYLKDLQKIEEAL